LLPVCRPGSPRAHGAAELPKDAREDRPRGLPGRDGGGGPLEGARTRPVADPLLAGDAAGGRAPLRGGAAPRAREVTRPHDVDPRLPRRDRTTAARAADAARPR